MNEFLKKLTSAPVIGSGILFIIGLSCLIFVLSKVSKTVFTYKIKMITLYISLILLQILIFYYDLFINHHTPITKNQFNFAGTGLANIAGYIFIPFEYVILASLLISIVKSTTVKKYLFISRIIFMILAILIFWLIGNFSRAVSLATGIEAIALIIPCLYFFYEVLRTPAIIRLNKESSFWIATGILFLFICLLPFYSAFEFIKKMTNLQILDSIGYILIILLFTKASFCKEALMV